MTPKQQRFIEAYDGNATRAAIQAGYSEKTACSIGERLLRNVDIKEAILKRERNRTMDIIATREERQSFWTGIMRNAEEKTTDRLKASELLAKSEGDFLDRCEVTGQAVGGLVIRWGTEEEKALPQE